MTRTTTGEIGQFTPYYFDPALQERLTRMFCAGELSTETNAIHGDIRLPAPGMIEPLPAPDSPEGRAAHEAGAAAVAAGSVAMIVLNGGMATRFGGGAKGTVAVKGNLSFLGLKITAARLLSQRYGGAVPVYLMNSLATHEPTMRHLATHGFFGYDPSLVTPFLQNTLLRLEPSGELLRDREGRLSPYGPGHGDLVEAVARSVLEDMESRGIVAVQVSNVDNVLATPDASLYGTHLLGGLPLTFEVVPNTGGDVGGGPLVVDGVFQIVEGFRLPSSYDMASLSDFNANTFYLSVSCFHRDYDLSWFVVRKKVESREAIQFERLAGQLSAFIPWACRRVPRDGPGSRFSPIKDQATLRTDRERIWATLRERGFLPKG